MEKIYSKFTFRDKLDIYSNWVPVVLMTNIASICGSLFVLLNVDKDYTYADFFMGISKNWFNFINRLHVLMGDIIEILWIFSGI